ncbi:Protein MAIN-LIKE 2 [Linum grandiflorum]
MLMERWRLETITFHMFHGECIIAVQDVANLTGLLVTGDAMYVEYEKEMNWAALVEEVLDKPPVAYLKNDRRLKMGWLHDSFDSCTDVADDDKTQLIHDAYSGIPEREYRAIPPLICFWRVMWHHPDRFLRQFVMEQHIPRTEMLESEVMALLGITRRWEVGMRETMQQYLARWEMRDDHVTETGLVGNLERRHFHDHYMDRYRTFSR